MMAVSTAMGLKMPGSQMDRGVSSVADHLLNWSTRRSRSWNQEDRERLLGHAYFSQEHLWKGLRPGTWLMLSAADRSSMGSDMLSEPSRPLRSSTRERRTSSSSAFMRSHSCTATIT